MNTATASAQHSASGSATARPIVKWAGGKGRLLPQLRPLLPSGLHGMRHVELFAGGGALFFDRAPAAALLADVNPALIATYRAVRDELPAVVCALRQLAHQHSDAHYYAVRARYNAGGLSLADRAAAFIYLNKTCFNGLHRVNRQGHFNVPVGRYESPRILDQVGLEAARVRLARAELRCGSFEVVAQLLGPGDFVYLDPPYMPISKTASFTRYARGGFGAAHQARLREVFGVLDRRGCRVMLSNSDTGEVRALYAGYPAVEVAALRCVNSAGHKRGRITELVVRNYE